MDAPPDLTLITLTGPHTVTPTVKAGSTVSIGRAADATVCLLNERVSRRHAVVLSRAGQWFLVDQGSSHGTFVNGVRLASDAPAALNSGDLIRIGPWTFRAVLGGAAPAVAQTIDDPGTTVRVERADTSAGPGAGRRLRLLTECIAGLNAGSNEQEILRVALRSALEGTGYARAAAIKRVGEPTEIELAASLRADASDQREFTFSRGLIKAASGGQTVVLFSGPEQVNSLSIAEMGIHSAMCTPVLIGEDLAGYLYLDARGSESAIRPDAAGFAEAVARACGLALASLKRSELDKRQRVLTAELTAARDAQQFILPPSRGALPFLRYAMRMKPGVFVAGDLFDLMTLPDARVAFCIGDVAGHGAGSGMIMATAQAHLHAQLAGGTGTGQAVDRLNEYLATRFTAGRFVSLWLGVLGPDGSLEFVDAGHGHWLLRRSAGDTQTMPGEEGIPVGIDPGQRYEVSRVRLSAGDRVLLYSDGVVEQRAPGGAEFSRERLEAAIAPSRDPDADVQRVFDAVLAFAGGGVLDDDATIASVEFRPA